MNAKEHQRAYSANRYAWLKQHGICVACASADAAPNRVRCPECAEKVNALNRRRYDNMTEEERQKLNAEVRERRRGRVERGLCMECGKPVYEKRSRVRCYECWLRQLRCGREHKLRVRLARSETVKTCALPKERACAPVRAQPCVPRKARVQTQNHPWRQANDLVFKNWR